ncbi:MAG: ferritin-like domain-containing protein [Thermodesulfobacteriota bacterium]
MNQTSSLGTNRTGIASAPERGKAMMTGPREFPPSSAGSARDVANVRVAYAKEAEPIGSVPLPPGVANKVQTAAKAVTGKSPTLFLDKLGERLAFERAGTRLYEAVISKYDAFGSFTGGPSRQDLEHLLREEYAHFLMLRRVIEQQGGDPTAVTPSADLQATASMGINKIIVDPRTTLLQSLEAIVVAELADHECWHALVALARDAGEDQLVKEFERARAEEQEHLKKVRAWLAAGQGRSQGGDGAAR